MALIDKTTIEILGSVIILEGIFVALIKFSPRELNMSFWDQNPFAVKRDIIETTKSWTFAAFTAFGVLIQILPKVFLTELPDRSASTLDYYLVFFISLFSTGVLVLILFKISNHFARLRWAPAIISSQYELLSIAKEITEHNGLTKKQFEGPDLKAQKDRVVKSNLEKAESYLSQIERLLEIKIIKSSNIERIEEIEKTIKHLTT